MEFRTPIENVKGTFEIDHSKRIVLLGSCFADNIGSKLEADGFNAVHNPLGPLFNPESICRILNRKGRPYSAEEFSEFNGIYHCLDFANRYQAESAEELAEKVNNDYLPFARDIENCDVLIITLGTTKVYKYRGQTVGNCHKLPNYLFEEHYLDTDEIFSAFKNANLPVQAKTIFTLSPVRYPGDGLSRGFLSKATLRVAIDKICSYFSFDYFPAFEIVNDDLRDYRFYAPDMRHPSEVAIEYIYSHFMEAYFSNTTKAEAIANRKITLRNNHRPIINS